MDEPARKLKGRWIPLNNVRSSSSPSREPRHRQLAEKMFQLFLCQSYAALFFFQMLLTFLGSPSATSDKVRSRFEGQYKHPNIEMYAMTHYLSLSRPRDKSIISLSFPNRQTRCSRCLGVAVAVAVAGRRTPYPATGDGSLTTVRRVRPASYYS